MITMKQARRQCPGSETKYKKRTEKEPVRLRHVLDKQGRVILTSEATWLMRVLRDVERPRRLTQPFRAWARETYGLLDERALSPKLRRVVFGASS